MIKLILSLTMPIALVGCATNSPAVRIDSTHPAHADAPAAATPAMSNTLAIEASPQPAAAPTTKEATDEHHHHGHH